MEWIKDHLLLEEEFIHNQEQLKLELSREEKNQDERSKVDNLHGIPTVVGTLEEIINNDLPSSALCLGWSHVWQSSVSLTRTTSNWVIWCYYTTRTKWSLVLWKMAQIPLSVS
jgi:hypothetical protein